MKVIAAGLPLKLCNDCGCLWGEPWVTIYDLIVVPIEGFFGNPEGFYFMGYEGSYWLALWHFLFKD